MTAYIADMGAMSMKEYIGTKQVKAKPMTRFEYCTLRGRDVPIDERGSDLGYLIEYAKGEDNPPNHADFEGYISWSPEKVFEGCYTHVSHKGCDDDSVKPHRKTPEELYILSWFKRIHESLFMDIHCACCGRSIELKEGYVAMPNGEQFGCLKCYAIRCKCSETEN